MSDMGTGGLPPTDRPLGDVLPESQTYPPPPLPSTSPYETSGAQGSTTDTARQQAGQVAQGAKESGKQVAGTAMQEGKSVAHEGRRQAQELTRQVGQQVDEQSRVQKDKAASGLRSLAAELQGMAASGSGGMGTDLARQAASTVQDAAGWLDEREPGQLLDEVRRFARRKPGTFLLGALAAGVAAGRLTRGAVDAARSDDDEPLSPPTTNGTTPAVTTHAGGVTATGPDLSTELAPEPTPLEPGYRAAAGGGYR